MANEAKQTPAFRPFIEACREHGIPKTTAYELMAEGKLQTFLIRRRRYIDMASLSSLPARLAAEVQE